MNANLEPLRKWAKDAANGKTDKIPYIDITDLIKENIELRAALAASGGNAAPGLTEKKIDAIWDALPGLSVISGQPQDQWNRLLRHEFARAIEAASAPNAALVAALERIAQPVNAGCGCSFPCRCDTPEAEEINAQAMRDIADEALAALSASGQEVGHGR